MTSRLVEKKHLSAKGLLAKAQEVFQKITEPLVGEQGKNKEISISDCLMSGLAIFKLKFPSLLQFDKEKQDTLREKNLKSLFKIKNVPSDTYLRERLDLINPDEIRPAFTSIFSALQRGKALEKYVFLEGKYLILSDGTGQISSKKVHCKNCCEKHHRNGTVTYHHQLLGAVIAHPDHKPVIPLCPESIRKEDGAKKNDCERNATERLLRKLRKEHPLLPIILAEDALASNGPHLLLLKELNMSHITVVKSDGNKALFDWVEAFEWNDVSKMDKTQGVFSFVDENSNTHKFRFANQVPLNNSHANLKVNFLEYWITNKNDKKTYHNTWITDILITINNVYDIAKGGRARWKVENETFNTLKNQGYHFEHNFGHGNENLSTVFPMLMMLAFLIDQCEQLCCGLFQGALKKMHSTKKYFWERIRGFFNFHIIPSWEALYRAIIEGAYQYAAILDSS